MMQNVTIFCTYLLIAAYSSMCELTGAFLPFRHHVVVISRRTRTLRKALHKDDDANEEEWILKDDWILVDTVPKFTLGSGKNTRTFWSQLSMSIPEFKRNQRSHEDLKKRYEKISRNSTGIYPCPDMLHDWWIDDTKNKILVGGNVDDKTIWFTPQCVGHINYCASKDSVGTMSKSLDLTTKTAVFAGNFVETIGGQIYELGQPRQNDDLTTMEMNSDIYEQANTDGNTKPTRTMTGTIAALLASSMLSAYIGFGAGMSVATVPLVQQLPTQHGGSLVKVESRSATTNSISKRSSGKSDKITMSISERRARAESKVYRDRRIITTIQDKLQQDEMELYKLQKAESNAASSLMFYSGGNRVERTQLHP